MANFGKYFIKLMLGILLVGMYENEIGLLSLTGIRKRSGCI